MINNGNRFTSTRIPANNSAAAQPMLMMTDRQHQQQPSAQHKQIRSSGLIVNTGYNNGSTFGGGASGTAGTVGPAAVGKKRDLLTGQFLLSSTFSSYSFLAKFTAWGIPALQTVAVLVARFVDADELLGEFNRSVMDGLCDWLGL